MKKACVGGLALVLACASTNVTSTDDTAPDATIPRPGRILAYDFGATPSDVAPDSGLAGQYDPQHEWSPQEEEEAEQLGVAVASRLVEDIRAMGMPAERGSGGPPPAIDDLVIRGNFVTIHEGSAAERMVVGFGAGAAKLTTVVEAYQMTSHGLRKLGSGEIDSGGPKGPGAAVPAAVALATANPIGLIVTTAIKGEGEMSGRTTVEGRAKSTADAIAARLRTRFQEQGWVQ